MFVNNRQHAAGRGSSHRSPVLPMTKRHQRRSSKLHVRPTLSKVAQCARLSLRRCNRRGIMLSLLFGLVAVVLLSTLLLKGHISEATPQPIAASHPLHPQHRVDAANRESSRTLGQYKADVENSSERSFDGVPRHAGSTRSRLKKLLLQKKKKMQLDFRISGKTMLVEDAIAMDEDGNGRGGGRITHDDDNDAGDDSNGAAGAFGIHGPVIQVRALLDHVDVVQNNNLKGGGLAKGRGRRRSIPGTQATSFEIPPLPTPTASSPKVFGIGLSKTGTSSLAHGLDLMGLRTIHSDVDRMRGLLGALGDEHQYMLGLLTGSGRASSSGGGGSSSNSVDSAATLPSSLRDAAKRDLLDRLDFRGLYDNVDAVVDAPTYLFWRQLATAYPDAKFVLTTRDREAWFQSAAAYFRFFFQKLSGGIVPRDTESLHNLTYVREEEEAQTNRTAFAVVAMHRTNSPQAHAR